MRKLNLIVLAAMAGISIAHTANAANVVCCTLPSGFNCGAQTMAGCLTACPECYDTGGGGGSSGGGSSSSTYMPLCSICTEGSWQSRNCSSYTIETTEYINCTRERQWVQPSSGTDGGLTITLTPILGICPAEGSGRLLEVSTQCRNRACAAGYYPTAARFTTQSVSDLKCAACPDGGTTEIGAESILDCHLPAGTEYTDDSGDFEYTNDCFYQQ